MALAETGIRGKRLDDTPFAVIDFETTGLRPGADRVVEVSIVRVDPRTENKLVLDTLVNPTRPMAATEVHGITADDVRDAPTFDEIAGAVSRAIAGCVVASYNVYFDMPFLQYELSRTGLESPLPHACVMWLRPLLGLGGRCCLRDACRQHGVSAGTSHAAADDALAAAGLLSFCLTAARNSGFTTFGDLSNRATYKFLTSFDDTPLTQDMAERLPSFATLKSRKSRGHEPAAAANPIAKKSDRALYWDALMAVLADLEVTDEEAESLSKTRAEAALTPDEVRGLHARAFGQAINQVIEDRRLDDRECLLLQRLHVALRRLGWAPGDPCGASGANSL